MGPTKNSPPREFDHLFGGRCPRTATFEAERREVFDSVLESMRIQEADADLVAACCYLLRHLAWSEPYG